MHTVAAQRTVVATGRAPRQEVGRGRTSARCGATYRAGSRLTQRSFGVSISGEIEPPTNCEHRDARVASIAARVVDRAVVHPHDDVACVVAVDADTVTGRPCCVERDQRARRVEADADDRIRPRRRRRRSRVLHRGDRPRARCRPTTARRSPARAASISIGVLAAPDQRAVEREQPGARARRADVDAEQTYVRRVTAAAAPARGSPSRRDSSTMSANTSPYATATWLLW